MKFSDVPVGAMWKHARDSDVYVKLSVSPHLRAEHSQNVGMSMNLTYHSFGEVFTTDPDSNDIELVETL